MTSLNIEQLPINYLFFIAGIFGAVAGSFISMLVHRLPNILQRQWNDECRAYLTEQNKNKDYSTASSVDEPPPESLAFPNSYCPHCNSPLRLIDNIPIFGFLINRGRCHNCSNTIHWRYLAIELLGVCVAILSILTFGVDISAVAAMLFGWTLLALLFIDLEHQLLPDSLTQLLLWGGLLINSKAIFTTLNSSLWGAVLGYLSLWLILHIYRIITGRDGMGYGDLKLLAALGAWCGWEMLPQIILIASITGILISIPALLRSNKALTSAIPFGPFLAIGGWSALLWGESINNIFAAIGRVFL
ncbi:MAG: prepilin peptidase [Thiotrichales bacterium]|jgi:leader peptidase (prepilin peptidase)/N-methyltransferase|nr:prepilin peptidase [Thiotrichales bacterium]MBT3614225.1 prepilin peptidase [Thiotrichales bacterium]MBT3752043.1 prepilin peptidase [Thiotrichales bacterium]MBT3837426.1 prepilin peptidase [Thiotrichales bacterium]MBT4152711.1 prepilin peptidase [Thiotrichales bacterium]